MCKSDSCAAAQTDCSERQTRINRSGSSADPPAPLIDILSEPLKRRTGPSAAARSGGRVRAAGSQTAQHGCHTLERLPVRRRAAPSLPCLPATHQARHRKQRSPKDTRSRILAPIFYSKSVRAVRKDDFKNKTTKRNLDA